MGPASAPQIGHPQAEAEDRHKTLFEDHATAGSSSFCARSKALVGHRGAKPRFLLPFYR